MCLVELVYLVDKGRIPASVIERVDRVLRDPASGFTLAPLDLRVIAATALALNLPLVTRDGKIRAANIHTIW